MRFLKEAKSLFAERIRHSIAPKNFGSPDYWRLCNRARSLFPAKLGQGLYSPLFNRLSSSADKNECFAHKFSSNSIFDSSGLISSLRTDSLMEGVICIGIHITPSMVSTIISNLDPNNACEPDGIPIIVIKKCVPERAPVLLKLFINCLAAACFLAYWKSSSVVPVFKDSSESSETSDYRPVSILSLLGKLLDALINAELVHHL